MQRAQRGDAMSDVAPPSPLIAGRQRPVPLLYTVTQFVAPRPIPVASFASVMGFVGLGLAWRTAAAAGRASGAIGEAIVALGACVFAALACAWIARIVVAPREIRAEHTVAITASFLGTITISLSLLAVAAVPYSAGVAFALWIAAAAGGCGLLIYLLGRWIRDGIPAYELTPAVLIPVVGNATSTYAAVPLGQSDFGWASFSFALLCWLMLAPIVTYRLIAVEPRLPRKMVPQLGLLVSSPAVLAGSWFALTGTADVVFKIFVFKSMFAALLVVRLWGMTRGERYNVAMWGWTFPAAALAGALERAATSLRSPLFSFSATVMLVCASCAVLACTLATVSGWLRAARNGRIAPGTV